MLITRGIQTEADSASVTYLLTCTLQPRLPFVPDSLLCALHSSGLSPGSLETLGLLLLLFALLRWPTSLHLMKLCFPFILLISPPLWNLPRPRPKVLIKLCMQFFELFKHNLNILQLFVCSSLSPQQLHCGGLECRKALLLLFVLPELRLTWQMEGLTNLHQIIYEKNK